MLERESDYFKTSEYINPTDFQARRAAQKGGTFLRETFSLSEI